MLTDMTMTFEFWTSPKIYTIPWPLPIIKFKTQESLILGLGLKSELILLCSSLHFSWNKVNCGNRAHMLCLL